MAVTSRERVTEILGGDLFRTKGRDEPVRLANVHAIERGDEINAKAAKLLKKLIGGKTVDVTEYTRDMDGNAWSRVMVNGQSVNLAIYRSFD